MAEVLRPTAIMHPDVPPVVPVLPDGWHAGEILSRTFVGNQTIVVDDGAFDCNGDGVADPNIITGGGAVRHGVTLGDVVSGAVRTIHGITLQ